MVIESQISEVSQVAHPSWIMARVAALLSQYYAADVPQSVVAMMAEDWREELKPYPQWAITKAVRWWKSEANTERKRRPLEGDIAARAKLETDLLRYAQFTVDRYRRGVRPTPAVIKASHVTEDEMTPEERAESRKRMAEYAANAGFSGPKRFGAGKRIGGEA